MRTATNAIKALKKAGYTQAAIAVEIDSSQATINRWSKKMPRFIDVKKVEKLQKLADKVCGEVVKNVK
jgi:transcriptional regulator with XRE-family HTH domain